MTKTPKSPGVQARALGRRIQQARKARKLTQVQLARQLGWKKDRLVNYEGGRREPGIAELYALATELADEPSVWFLDDDEIASIVRRLLQDNTFRQQVLFFAQTLDDTETEGI